MAQRCKAVLVPLSQIAPLAAEDVARSPLEIAYRRGFCHAISCLSGLVHTERLTPDDWNILQEIALEFRFDGKPHPLYWADITREWDRQKKQRAGGSS